MIQKYTDYEFPSNHEALESLGARTKEISDKLPKIKKESPDLLLQVLNEAYMNQELVLVLGAGVSMDYGTPNWNNLMQKLMMLTIEQNQDTALLLSKLFSNLFMPSSVIIGRYLQNHFEDAQETLVFENEVRRILYESTNKKEHSALMKEIAKFCIAAGKSPNLDSIISYNYDDILETYLTSLKLDIPFKPIYGNGMVHKSGQLPIYHVHGYLPEKGRLDKDNHITLSEGFYHQQYSDIYSWNNITQINKFKDKTCLFLGTSLTDPNTRRLLDIARIQKGDRHHFHYIIKKEYELEEIKEELKRLIQRKPDEQVTTNLKLDETASLLKQIIERFEENDCLSLGVKTIWVKSFDEYPELLSKVKKVKS